MESETLSSSSSATVDSYVILAKLLIQFGNAIFVSVEWE